MQKKRKKEIKYDTFGQILSDSNPNFDFPFRFAGGLWDEDTKLVRFGVRDYDPEVGRWTSKEPLGFAGSRNFYVYVNNNPVSFRDPTGLNKCDALKNLIDYEKEYGKGGILWGNDYSSHNNYNLTNLNYSYNSVYGLVNIDWMLRVSLWGIGVYNESFNKISLAILGVFWQSIKGIAKLFGGERSWGYDRVLTIEKMNAAKASYHWLNSNLTLEDIFKPSLDDCFDPCYNGMYSCTCEPSSPDGIGRY